MEDRSRSAAILTGARALKKSGYGVWLATVCLLLAGIAIRKEEGEP